MADKKYGSPAEIMALPPAKLIAILEDSEASVYATAKACQRLAVVGDKTAVPALAALFTEPKGTGLRTTGSVLAKPLPRLLP